MYIAAIVATYLVITYVFTFILAKSTNKTVSVFSLNSTLFSASVTFLLVYFKVI